MTAQHPQNTTDEDSVKLPKSMALAFSGYPEEKCTGKGGTNKKFIYQSDSTQRMEPKHERETQGIILENNHVHGVYEKTSKHFADIEQRAWPKVKRFLQDLKPGALVADVGCGNGRYLSVNKDICVIGSDRCQGLVDIAGCQGHQVLTCDNLSLPFRDGSFDAVISISVIHHFSTRRRRSKAVCELARILSPGGKVLIYVMAMEQHFRKFESQDVLVPWNFQPGIKSLKGSISRRSSSASLNEYENSDDSYQVSDSSVGAHSNGFHDKSAKRLHESGYASDQNLDSFQNSKSAKSGVAAAVTYFTATHHAVEFRPKKLAEAKQRSASLSDTIKSKFLGLLGKDGWSKSLDCSTVEKQKTQWHKDMNYKKLVDYILMEEAELLSRASLDPDGCIPVFAVREFPGSSKVARPEPDLTEKCLSKESKEENFDNGHLRNGVSKDQSLTGATTHNSPGNRALSNGHSNTQKCSVDSSNDRSKAVGVDVDMVELHNWVATTTKAIEVMQAQVKSGVEPKQDIMYQCSKLEAISQYKDRMASNAPPMHTSPESVSSNTSSEYENEVPIGARQSSDTCSISSDSWSDFDNLEGQLADQLNLGDGAESPEELTENTQNGKEDETMSDASPAYHRYYHVFKEGELCDLIDRYVKSLKVVKSYYDHGNWCVIAEKIP